MSIRKQGIVPCRSALPNANVVENETDLRCTGTELGLQPRVWSSGAGFQFPLHEFFAISPWYLKLLRFQYGGHWGHSGAISTRLPAGICGPLRGRAERLAFSLLHLPETFPRRKGSSTGLQSSRDCCPAAFVPSNRDGLLRYQSSEVRGTDAHQKSTSQR